MRWRTVAVLEEDGVARRVDLLRPQRHVVELRARVQLQPVKSAHTILAVIFGEDCHNNRAAHLYSTVARTVPAMAWAMVGWVLSV